MELSKALLLMAAEHGLLSTACLSGQHGHPADQAGLIFMHNSSIMSILMCVTLQAEGGTPNMSRHSLMTLERRFQELVKQSSPRASLGSGNG